MIVCGFLGQILGKLSRKKKDPKFSHIQNWFFNCVFIRKLNLNQTKRKV